MKTRIFLLCMALSATAWGAEPAASNMAAPADSTTTSAATSSDQQPAATTAAPQASDTAQQNAPATTGDTQQKSSDDSAESGFSRGSVVRSLFTSGVKDREPINKLNDAKTSDDHIFYYTELRDMSGQTAIHRWSYKGKVMAEVKFKVRGPRWRVWSSKTIPAGDTGEWKVSVLNGAGQVIAEDMIDYTGQPASQAPATTDKPAPTQQQQPAAEDQSAPANSSDGGNGGM